MSSRPLTAGAKVSPAMRICWIDAGVALTVPSVAAPTSLAAMSAPGSAETTGGSAARAVAVAVMLASSWSRRSASALAWRSALMASQTLADRVTLEQPAEDFQLAAGTRGCSR
jgi:hypothetical protein